MSHYEQPDHPPSEAHQKTRIRQLEDAAAHWEHKYTNARQYNRNLEERNKRLEAALRNLIHAARTAGGVAGRDEYLCQYCTEAEIALAGSAPETKGDERG